MMPVHVLVLELLILMLVMGLERRGVLRGRGGSANGGGRRGMSATAAIRMRGDLLEGTYDLCCFHVSSILGSTRPSPISTSA